MSILFWVNKIDENQIRSKGVNELGIALKTNNTLSYLDIRIFEA